MAFKDELLAGTYTKARVETCLWKDGSDDYYQSIEEVLGYRHIYGSFGCDVNFTFNVAGDALTGTLIKAQIQDNLDDYLFYTLNGGKTFNEDKEYWFIHTQKYDNRPDTFTGWRHTNSGNGFNEMKLWRWADFEEDAQGNYGLDRMWGIEPDTRVYAREFTVSGNIVTVTPLGSGASIPTERTVYDDSYAVQNLAIDSNGVITFATPTYQGNKNDLSYLVLMTDSNNKNWQFWCDGVSNMPTVSLTPKWLWSQVGENYEPPEGEYTFNNVSVLTYANPRRTHRVFAKKSMDISDATLKLNVNKSAEIYRIDCDTESHTMTLNLRNMPAELVSVLAWACEHPNDNNSQGKVILSVSYGTYWDEGRARSQSVKNNMVQLDANGNAVKVILSNYLDGDDALIAGCEEASMWYMTFTVTDESGNVTAYVTNIFCHGDVDIDELANDGIGRVLGGSNLAY